MQKVGIKRPSPAMAVAIAALIIATTGTAWAISIPPNSVGSRQLKAAAITTGKIANGAVTAAKVGEGSLTGADINMAALGAVPLAANAQNAQNAQSVDHHEASCPPKTTLIRGLCFDTASNPVAPNLDTASEACAAKGGWLPSPMELYSVKGILDLGTGTGTSHQFTDEYYYDAATGSDPSTVVIDGTGAITQVPITEPSQYFCVYPLVR